MPDAGAAIAVLAAGEAIRFGGGKLDRDCAGRALGSWATRAADGAGFTKRIIVVGPDAPAFIAELKDWVLVVNDHPALGLASSVACAAHAAAGSARLVVALADMPLVGPRHLTALLERSGIVFTEYPGGKRGVPAAFPHSAFARLAQLRGSAADAEWQEPVATIPPCTPGMLRDVDTPADLAAVAALLRPRG